MLWKGCAQYDSKFGKLSSSHRTGKSQLSFQSQRKTMPKNVQTTTQLHSSHKLAKQCSKFSKPGFNSTWTMKFQMFKLDLEKAEKPEIELPTSTGSSKKEEHSRKTSTSASLTTLKLLTCGSQQTRDGKFFKRWEYQTTLPVSWEICSILEEMGIPDHLTCLLRNLCADHKKLEYSSINGNTRHLTCLLRNLYANQEATVRTGYEAKDWFQTGKGLHQVCIFTLLI